MQLAGALLANPHVDLQLYLHKLMPALLTCLLTKRLGASPWDSHWQVRSLAAGAALPPCPPCPGAWHRAVEPCSTAGDLRVVHSSPCPFSWRALHPKP